MKNHICRLLALLAVVGQVDLTLAQDRRGGSLITRNQGEMLPPAPAATAAVQNGLFEHTERNQADIEQKYPKRMFKDGEIIPYPTPEPGPRSAIYGRPNPEGEKRIEADALEFSKKHGTAPTILVTPVPQEPEDLVYYEIPQAFIIGGCLYTNGYSYPEACSDSNGKELFRAGKDPQSKLDEIREAYGVPSSDNNIVPPTYTIFPEIESELANAQGKVEVLREVNTSEIVDTADGL